MLHYQLKVRQTNIGGFFFSISFIILFGVLDLLYTIGTGIGVWGLNKTVNWAWDITNFVWWIGIGHAGTLISAVLLLFRQKWRMSINRSAEAMTIFGVAQAALFPLIHMGRPWLAYWVFPNTKYNLVHYGKILIHHYLGCVCYLYIFFSISCVLVYWAYT